jgi:hypothetical protein
MKYILTQTDGNILGAFTTVSQNADSWVADDSIYYTSIFGVMTSSEVADDYESPNYIAAYNQKQSNLREEQYKLISDPIFFQYQRGAKTEKEWLDAVNAIKTQLPYKA